MINDKYEYFLTETNKRLDAIEDKMDKLLSFKFMLIGASISVSSLITLGINLAFIYLDSHH